MAIQNTTLRKLLEVFFAAQNRRRALLLADIRSEAKKGIPDRSGGDFYEPFWFDVKQHAAGKTDLPTQTVARIIANKSRGRLYPILQECFFEIWTDKMRWRNEPFQFVSQSIRAQVKLGEIDAIYRIENTASVKLWDGSHRIMYPYFCEKTALNNEALRLAFWALSEALPNFDTNDLRIIDFHRRAYYRSSDVHLSGDERHQFIERYRRVLIEWEQLRSER